MATEKELRETIKKEGGGTWMDCYGPMRIGTAKVWEIWTTGKGQSRFWLEEENGSEKYFSCFCDLIERLEDTKMSTIYAPGNMTVGQLVRALKPAQLWEVGAAIVIILGFFFYLGAKLGHSFFGL
jgi:hypothetical protein